MLLNLLDEAVVSRWNSLSLLWSCGHATHGHYTTGKETGTLNDISDLVPNQLSSQSLSLSPLFLSILFYHYLIIIIISNNHSPNRFSTIFPGGEFCLTQCMYASKETCKDTERKEKWFKNLVSIFFIKKITMKKYELLRFENGLLQFQNNKKP